MAQDDRPWLVLVWAHGTDAHGQLDRDSTARFATMKSAQTYAIAASEDGGVKAEVYEGTSNVANRVAVYINGIPARDTRTTRGGDTE